MIPSKRPNLIVLNLGIGKVLDHNGPGALPETNERKTVSSASSHSYPRRLYRQVPSASLQRPNEENHRCLDGPCKIKLFLIWRRLIQPGERSLPITKITALSGLNHSIWQLDGYIYICWGCSRDASLMKDKAIRVVRRFPRLNPESRRLVEVTLGNNVGVGRHIFIGSFHKLISSIEQTVVATFSYPCLWWKLHEFQSKSLHLQIDRLTCRRGLYQKNSENNTKQV